MTRHMEVERSVLGTMLAENYLIVDGGVRKDYFTTHVHKNIFNCMRKTYLQTGLVDEMVVLTKADPETLGGANYVVELMRFARSTTFNEYVEVMREGWKLREKHRILIAAADMNWTIEAIQQALDLLEKEGVTGDTCIQADLVQMSERPYEEKEEVSGVLSGLATVDRLLDGFQPAELTIIAARPSMGKTDLLNHFALQAGRAGYQPIVFSLEMSKKSMIDRLIAAIGGYSRLRMRNPYKYFTQEQKLKWLTVIGSLDKMNIHIDERAGLTVAEMRAVARRVIHKDSARKPIILVDYLQIIRGDAQYRNRTEVVGEISNGLKQMAKEFDCPVVCLSQLNRGVEARNDKRPVMSDLRDSGNIEQDADVIGFLYREDYYSGASDHPSLLEIHIAKNRNGPTGTAVVGYVKETGIVHNIG